MEKLLALVNLGQRAYGKRLSARLFSGAIVVAGLTIIISIMLSAILIGGLYAAYFALLGNGTPPQTAMLIIGTAAIVTILILITLTFICIYYIRKTPPLFDRSPLTSRAMDLLDAFLDGLTTPPKKP